MLNQMASELISLNYIEKPRETGLTSVIDKGIPVSQLNQELTLVEDYVDIIKLAFGTSALYSTECLKEKVKLIRDHHIKAMPGGTFFELFYRENKFQHYLEFCDQHGFDTIEISDGCTEISAEEKCHCIAEAGRRGFCVISEVGSKDEVKDRNISVKSRSQMIQEELNAGAWKVICEARESGTLGIFNSKGEVNHDMADYLIKNNDLEKVIFEAPLKKQQVWLINELGSDVNLGNISLKEVMSLQALRLKLRADTIS